MSKTPVIGLLITSDAALQLRKKLSSIHGLTPKNGALHEFARECLEILDGADAGVFAACEVGPVWHSGVRSDLATYAANLARRQALMLAQGGHAEAKANALEANNE